MKNLIARIALAEKPASALALLRLQEIVLLATFALLVRRPKRRR